MSRLMKRLEKRLDNYAILHTFSPGQANKKVFEYLRRIPAINKKRKRKYKSLVYYRKQIKCCESVKKGLEGFARSYEGMNPEEEQNHDEAARSFIIEIFPENRENVFYLINYYHEQKTKVKKKY